MSMKARTGQFGENKGNAVGRPLETPWNPNSFCKHARFIHLSALLARNPLHIHGGTKSCFHVNGESLSWLTDFSPLPLPPLFCLDGGCTCFPLYVQIIIGPPVLSAANEMFLKGIENKVTKKCNEKKKKKCY